MLITLIAKPTFCQLNDEFLYWLTKHWILSLKMEFEVFDKMSSMFPCSLYCRPRTIVIPYRVYIYRPRFLLFSNLAFNSGYSI